jgi:serine/threonine protein kinase
MLVELLMHGVVPMNKLGIYHGDIKESNVLVGKDGFARLIDWGLSTYYIPFKNHDFPKSWRNRPFQFNTPFSVIIFSDKFIEKYSKFVETHKNNINEIILKPFIVEFIYYWMKERGPGHFKFINGIMYKLFGNEKGLKNMNDSEKEYKTKVVEVQYTIPYITNYILKILLNFTRVKENGKVSFREYLDQVFIKIVDIYGFISSYYPLLQIYHENYFILSTNEMKIFNKIKEIFLLYLYEPRIQPIEIGKLVNDFKSLNPLFENEERLKAKTMNVLTITMNKTKRNKSTSSTKLKSSSSKTLKNKK